jgi:lipase
MTSPPDTLPVLTFGGGPRLAVAVHGITASAMQWSAVARLLGPGWTLVAPDLRGRGAAAGLPAGSGLHGHAQDVCALLRARGPDRAVLVGHSMGAYVALLAAVAEPDLFDRVVLVDGGLPLPAPPAGTDVDAVLAATLGPAIARLSATFASEQDYLDFFRAHPALAADWNDDVAAYVRYDLTGEPGALRSRVVGEAVRTDGRDVLERAGEFGAAWDALTVPAVLLRAPLGLMGQPPGMLGEDAVADARRRRPDIPVETLDGANHYTIVFADRFAARVAEAAAAG